MSLQLVFSPGPSRAFQLPTRSPGFSGQGEGSSQNGQHRQVLVPPSRLFAGYGSQDPNVLAFSEPDPEIVIDRGQRGSLLNSSHRSDQDAGDFFFPERRKESTERAVWMLMRHRSWGDLEKKTACCQS